MMLRPLGDRVILKAVPKEDVTKSGIILPDTASEKRPDQGEIVAVGPGRLLEDGKRAEMSVAVGQKVVFKKYASDEVKLDGQDFLVISESDIVAVLE